MDSGNELILPHFEGMQTFLSEYILQLLYETEHIFTDVDYDGHIDDITMLDNTYPSASGSERANMTISIYRDNIDLVLAKQGVFLADPFGAKLSDIVELFKGCTLLGTRPLNELLAFTVVDSDVVVEEYFANIISELTTLEPHQVVELVQSVSESTIEYLHQNIPLPHVEVHSVNLHRDRFLKHLPDVEHSGIVVDMIKSINNFDYSPFVFIQAIRNQLLELNKYEMADEIYLLMLGSHTVTPELQKTTTSVIDTFVESLSEKMELTTLVINKLRTMAHDDE
jgi:hypothetical protein